MIIYSHFRLNPLGTTKLGCGLGFNNGGEFSS